MNAVIATLARILALGVAACGVSWAGPLQKAQVAADARWVIHLDVEALLKADLGKTLASAALDPYLSKAASELKTRLGVEFDWRRIRSLTVYGSDFTGPEQQRGVLLVDTDMDVAKAFETALARFSAGEGHDDRPLVRVADESTPLYCIHQELYVSAPAGKPVVVSRTRPNLTKAREVFTGAAPNLGGSKGFGEFCQADEGFFFLAAAQGFSEAAPVPPQARVLKMADGLRLSLGEISGQVQASLALSTKNSDGARQVQQVVQGMLALAVLGGSEDPDLQMVLNGTRVSLSERVVTLNLSVPSGKISQRILEEEKKQRGQN